mmetsp:Transcript_3984/g.7681  ORF Transcript_3984/g.7681 Transcript_3984/m.7681 type:complete len:219 (-) Transcript_3984:175-831(-)
MRAEIASMTRSSGGWTAWRRHACKRTCTKAAEGAAKRGKKTIKLFLAPSSPDCIVSSAAAMAFLTCTALSAGSTDDASSLRGRQSARILPSLTSPSKRSAAASVPARSHSVASSMPSCPSMRADTSCSRRPSSLTEQAPSSSCRRSRCLTSGSLASAGRLLRSLSQTAMQSAPWSSWRAAKASKTSCRSRDACRRQAPAARNINEPCWSSITALQDLL